MENQTQRIKRLAEATKDAYSADRYRSWRGVIATLVRMKGYSDREVEAVVRSKWTRWAADLVAGKYAYGRVPSGALISYILRHESPASLEALVAETFDQGPRDLQVADHGTVVLFQPISQRGRDWTQAQIGHAMRWGGAYCVEARYVPAIVEGAKEAGLRIGGGAWLRNRG